MAALPATHSARKALERFGGDREAFLCHFAERYFSVLCGAIREADSDHMILGCRFAGPFSQVHPVLWEICGKYCDIVSFNCYPWATSTEASSSMAKAAVPSRISSPKSTTGRASPSS